MSVLKKTSVTGRNTEFAYCQDKFQTVIYLLWKSYRKTKKTCVSGLTRVQIVCMRNYEDVKSLAICSAGACVENQKSLTSYNKQQQKKYI